MPPRFTLTRAQVLAFRRRVGGLQQRLPARTESLRRAAWAGLQDSMPRAALLSLHARVDGVKPWTWEDESLVQLWGPRYSTYVVPRRDFALFSLGRMPASAKGRERAMRIAEELRKHLDGDRSTDRAIGSALGIHSNALRYAAPTGTVAIRWGGARAPVVWTVPAPDVDPAHARQELARRFLHVFGPSAPDAFATWAGISRRAAAQTFAALGPELLAVRTPLGDEWLLAQDESAARARTADASARLLPSGDAYYLLAGAQRELLVPDEGRRGRLWTPRVWPGAVLVDGEIAGTWRRAQHAVTIETWERLTAAQRDAVEAEAHVLPLPGLERPIEVVWDP